MKKTILAAALAASMLPTFAADFFVVVPVKGRSNQVAVALNSYGLPVGVVGQPYSGFDFNTVLMVSNDTAFNPNGVSWAVSSGTLPAGLQLTSTGLLQGTPTSSGTKSFEVTATYRSVSGQQTFQVQVAGTIALYTAKLPYAKLNKAYSYDLKPLLRSSTNEVNAGAAVWSLTAGSLPAGLALNSATGVISGAATQIETQVVTVMATYEGALASQSYTLMVPLYAADFSEDPVSFGGVEVNAGATKVLTITSAGNSTLSISSKTVSGTGFSLVSTTCGASLVVDATCTATIKALPTDSESISGTFKLVTNGGTYSIPLTATGVMPNNQVAYTKPGTYTWTAPAGVTSVSVVAVGGGGVVSSYGGGGGGLGWKNNIPVVPGTKYAVVVGAAGKVSYFSSATLVAGNGGAITAGGTFVGDGGGNGGKGAAGGTYNQAGGGGAGGYTGNGGNGLASGGGAGQGGGGGGGAGSEYNTGGGGGGGVGLLGQGANGAGGVGGGYGTNSHGKGGSGGAAGTYSTGAGGLYGGGGSGGGSGAGGGAGGSGAVRIIWPGDARLFPATRTGNE